MLAWAPLTLIHENDTFIAKANDHVRIEIVVPNPSNDSVLAQIERFGEGPGAHRANLKASLQSIMNCWDKVQNKAMFRVWTTDLIPLFSATFVDDVENVTYAAADWPSGSRLLLRIAKGELFDLHLDTVETYKGNELVDADDFAQAIAILS